MKKQLVLCALARNRKKKSLNKSRPNPALHCGENKKNIIFYSIFLIFPKMELISEFQFYSTF